LHKE